MRVEFHGQAVRASNTNPLEEFFMTIAEIAKGLVDFCRKGDFAGAVEKYYSADIVSVEPHAMNNMPREMHGIDTIKKKGEWWVNNHTVHEMTVGEPFLSEDKFAVEFSMDATEKKSGKRMKGVEIGVYTVKGGKI